MDFFYSPFFWEEERTFCNKNVINVEILETGSRKKSKNKKNKIVAIATRKEKKLIYNEPIKQGEVIKKWKS